MKDIVRLAVSIIKKRLRQMGHIAQNHREEYIKTPSSYALAGMEEDFLRYVRDVNALTDFLDSIVDEAADEGEAAQ